MKRIQDTKHLENVAYKLNGFCTDYPKLEGADFVVDVVSRKILQSAAKRLRARAAVLELHIEQQRLEAAQERVRAAVQKVGRK